MTPPFSLGAVHRDDELLDLLAARRRPADDAHAGDPAVRLLAALAADADTDLPAGPDSLDDLAVEVLAAAFAAQSARTSRGPSSPSEPVREVPRRRRGQVVLVRRGVAAIAGLAMVVTSAAVAAAVTGDPAGAFGLRAIASIASIVSGRHSEHPTASDTAVRRLSSDIADAARRSPLDPAQVARLEAQAQRLPGGGPPQLRAALAQLRAELDAQTGAGSSAPSDQPSHDPPSHSQPSHTQPSHTQPTHTQPTHTQPTNNGQPSHTQASHTAQSSHTSSGQASGRTKQAPTTPAVPTGQTSGKASGKPSGKGTGQPTDKGTGPPSTAPAGGGGRSGGAQAPR